MTFGHAVGMTVLGVVGVLVAYWIFRVLAGVFIFFGEVALVVVLVAAVFWFVLARTRFGIHTLAIGSSPEAASRAVAQDAAHHALGARRHGRARRQL